MPDSFQRLFLTSPPGSLPLNAQADPGDVAAPERSQFAHLFGHLLERFFQNETVSADGDAKARLVLIASTAGLPPSLVALYLWPDYHSFIPYMRGDRLVWLPGPPPYWAQVNQHLFFVLYSFTVMGIATVFQWDRFFPDLLDLWVLESLPVAGARAFLARVAAIGVYIGGFLLGANVLAMLVLPAAVDPPKLSRLLAAHLVAVFGSGLFAAACILAAQGLLLSILGERLFERVSLLLQGMSIAVLLMLLLLSPVLSGAVPFVLQSGGGYALLVPPLWFLGIYQRLLEGPSALPVYAQLAQTGCMALVLVVALALLAYPLAYPRRVRQLIEGPGARPGRDRPSLSSLLSDRLIHGTLARPPVRRAVYHFIGQTLVRVERYRIYLALYGGVGAAIVAASILRLSVVHNEVRMEISLDGVRAATGVVAFWLISGLRMAFVSHGNEQGSWVFRIVHGRPPHFKAAIEQLGAARVWVLCWGSIVTCGSSLALRVLALRVLDREEPLLWPAAASEVLVAAGMCLLLTDVIFLNVRVVAFTGERGREQSSLAASVLRYFAFVPAVAWVSLVSERWIESSAGHLLPAAAAIAVAHLALRLLHRSGVRELSNTPGLEEGEEEFLLKLGLHD